MSLSILYALAMLLTPVRVPAGPALHFELVEAPAAPVIDEGHPGLLGNLHGFEGGSVVRVAGVYHLFVAEMSGEPFWVKMRLAHWSSRDARAWRRESTLCETTGRIDRSDRRFSLWAPMPIWDERSAVWNLFYVAYQPGPGGAAGLHWLGRIWRAVSTVRGRSGIGGPYRDAGVVLQPDGGTQAWEGQQATDSFYPYRVGHGWLAFYGGHNYDPPGPWLVGLAESRGLAGPWRRLPQGNPVGVERVFVENPIVARVGHDLVAIYDSAGVGGPTEYVADGRHVGFSTSRDGRTWSVGGRISMLPAEGWSSDVRTPLCLIDEGQGIYTMLYTAQRRGRSFWSVGLARLRVVR